MTIYAWTLLPGAYHLALRTSIVSLSRSMRTIQHRFSQSYNKRNAAFGPFWQGRYKAVLMPDQTDFRDLLAYVHLRPVVSGLAESPAEYPHCGHREIIGRRRATLVDVDEVLSLFAESSRTARRRYNALLSSAAELDWISSEPGWLPWWRVGRPAASADATAGGQPKAKPRVLSEDEVYLLVEVCAELLKIPRELLESRLKSREIVKARELLAVVAVERFGVRVKDLATMLNKAPESVSRWVSLTLRRRTADAEFRQELDDLTTAIESNLKR